MLIKKKLFDIQLYDRRRRSIIVLSILILFISLTQFIIPCTIYLHNSQQFSDSLEILIRFSILIHHFIPFVLHLYASIEVLIELIKHQRRFGITRHWIYLIWKQFTKHRDVFLQPTVYICCTAPFIMCFTTGVYIDDNCTKISRVFSIKHRLIFFLGIFFVPVLFTFPVVIWPNEIYMIEFQNSSLVGKVYLKIKTHCCCCRNRTEQNETIS